MENKIKEIVYKIINHKLLSELLQYEPIENKLTFIEEFEKDRENIAIYIINYAKENNLPKPVGISSNNIEYDHIKNIKKRVEIENYIQEVFIQSEKKENIKDKIQYLINYKYIKKPKSIGYNKEIDPNPIDYETEIQKRIDELKRGEPVPEPGKPKENNLSLTAKFYLLKELGFFDAKEVKKRKAGNQYEIMSNLLNIHVDNIRKEYYNYRNNSQDAIWKSFSKNTQETLNQLLKKMRV